MRLLALLAAVVLAVLTATGCGPLENPSATAPSPSPSPSLSASSPAALPSRREVPRPTAAQARAYLATIARIDPGLVVNRERALRRARGVCDRIVNPPGGTLTLTRYTAVMLSGGDAQINERQARQVIRAVRVWCR